MAETEKIIYVLTHAGENPDICTIPFVLANAAQAMDVEAVVVLQSTAVFLAKKGYVEHVFAPGLPALKGLMDNFLAEGGRLLVCTPCIKERGITEDELIEAAQPTAAGTLVNEFLTANASLVY